MTFKQFLTSILACTIIGWGIWIVILFTVDPLFAGGMEYVLFYLSFFLGVSGTYTLLSLLVRRRTHPEDLLLRQVAVSARQAVLLGLFLSFVSFLSAHNLLTWWSILGLLVLLVIIEIFFETRRKRPELPTDT